MMWLVIILLILLILLVIIILTKLTIKIDYYHGNDNDHIKLEFKIWFGLIKYKKEIPMVKIDEDSPTIVYKSETKKGKENQTTKEEDKVITKDKVINSFHDAYKLLQHVVKLHSIVRNFLSKVQVKNIEWYSAMGVGDAAYTGMLVGGIWAIKGSIIGIISHYMKLSEMPKMTVTPCFQQTISQTRFKCMFQFRIGQAILAGLKLIKFWKGGLPHFKTKPLSVLSNNKPNSV
jgi:hypothetical protein